MLKKFVYCRTDVAKHLMDLYVLDGNIFRLYDVNVCLAMPYSDIEAGITHFSC